MSRKPKTTEATKTATPEATENAVPSPLGATEPEPRDVAVVELTNGTVREDY